MLDEILPRRVAVAATRDEIEADLFPEEMDAIRNAVEQRRREFVTARACARRALMQLGLPAQAIPQGEKGAPHWPNGVVGSITHCDGYRACAVACARDFAAIGVDAEPNLPLPDGLLGDIACPEERASLRNLGAEMPGVCWDRLVFSVKEAVYKAWFPLAKQWLGFDEAVTTINPQQGTFHARLLVRGPHLGSRRITGFSGKWTVQDGIVLAAIALPAADAE